MTSTHFSSAIRSCSISPAWTREDGDALTICGWVRYDSRPEDYNFIVHVNGEVDGGIILMPEAGSSTDPLVLAVWGGGGWLKPSTGYVPGAGEWFFFAITASGTSATLRVSTDYETITHTATTNSVTEFWSYNKITIGGDASEASYFPGQVHHVRVFNSSLSESEILAELASTTAAGAPWAAWELEDAKINDYSGNGRHLTGSGGTITTGSSSSPPQPNNATTIGSSF